MNVPRRRAGLLGPLGLLCTACVLVGGGRLGVMSAGSAGIHDAIDTAASDPRSQGYRMAGGSGSVYSFGLPDEGSVTYPLARPVVGLAQTASGLGYWLVAGDGGIFPFGDAVQHSYGSTGAVRLNQPIVGMAPTASGNGYWLVAADGGIFPFGDALLHSYGSTGAVRLNQPMVGMAPTPSGNGYWLVAADGGIFPFGDALQRSFGSTGAIRLNRPIVGMASTASGNGYWLVAADGGIFPFGDALQHSYGSTGAIRLNQPIVGMAATASGNGYWLVAADGGVFPFGDAPGYGSAGGQRIPAPIVGVGSATVSTSALQPPSSAWPSAASTGYPHGLAGDTRAPIGLGAPESGITVTTPGAVISGRHFTSRVDVLADNVTIKNSLIDSQGDWGVLLGNASHCNVNLVVEDTEIDGDGGKGANATNAAINQYNYCKPDAAVLSSDPLAWTCLRCDIHDNEDGVKLSSRNLLQDSWIHNLYHPTSTHHSDGFQLSDGAWSTVQHNFIDVGASGEPFTDGSMFIDAEVGWGGVHDITMDGNLLRGGLYPVWIYDEKRSGPTQITGMIIVTNNRVFRRSFAGSSVVLNNDGAYIHPFVQSGNVWFDASSAGPAGQLIPDLTSSGQG